MSPRYGASKPNKLAGGFEARLELVTFSDFADIRDTAYQNMGDGYMKNFLTSALFFEQDRVYRQSESVRRIREHAKRESSHLHMNRALSQ